MSNEIDVSDRDSLQGGGGTHPGRVLCLILAQAVADSSSAVAFQQTDDSTTLRYEVGGYWHEMVPPPPEVMGPLLCILKEKAGLSADADWGEGEVVLRTEKGPVVFRLAVCIDLQGRSLAILYKVPVHDPNVRD